MTFHTAAYFEDPAAAITNGQINALADGVLTIRNNSFFLERSRKLLYAAVFGNALDAARLDSPTLRDIARPQIAPLGDGNIPVATGPRVADLTPTNLVIPGEEEVALQVSDATAVANDITGVIGLETARDSVPPGVATTILATSTTAATANAWSDVTLTFENSLRAGRYAVIGLAAYSTNMISARLNFTSVNGQKERPGCIGGPAQDSLTSNLFRYGRLGVWGRFDNVILPEIQVLCDGADASFRFLIDIVKLAA